MSDAQRPLGFLALTVDESETHASSGVCVCCVTDRFLELASPWDLVVAYRIVRLGRGWPELRQAVAEYLSVGAGSADSHAPPREGGEGSMPPRRRYFIYQRHRF